MQRIVITGSESTGKTTLARQLAAEFATAWVPEYSRWYAEHTPRALTADDVAPIAFGQITWEDAALVTYARAPLLFFDTDLVSTCVYAEHYYGTCADWVRQRARSGRADLYLLCSPDIAWEADGVRDQPDRRLELHRKFVDRLREFGARYCEVSGQGPARLASAIQCVRSAFPGPVSLTA